MSEQGSVVEAFRIMAANKSLSQAELHDLIREGIHAALAKRFGGKGEKIVENNKEAARKGQDFVDEEYDRGAIIAQWPVPVKDGDDPDRLAARVLDVEHRVLPETVAALARGDVAMDPRGRVRWSRPWFDGDRFVLAPRPDG